MRTRSLILAICMVLLPVTVQSKVPLKDQVVLITGASGDIGLHAAKQFLKEGAFVVAHYNSRQGELKTLEKQYPTQIKLVACDFRDPKNADNLWKEAISWKKHVNIVINSSGIEKEAKTSNDIYPVMMETMAINYFAPVVVCTRALEHFSESKTTGVIINLGSRAAYRGMPEGYYHYSDSKAALTRYTQQIAKAHANKGVTAVVIAPGPVEGQMFNQLEPAVRQQCLDSVPTKQPVKLDEVVNVIMFFASQQAPSGTGGVFDLMGASWSH
jgi:3-oxoacyl-[acyl-carrier protein] reductase